MGIKMSKAVSLASGKVVTTQDFENGNSDPLKCYTAICAAKITPVSKHKKQISDKTVTVSTYFRLTNKEQSPHHINCPFTTKGCLKVIARDSDTEIFEAMEEDHYEYRLHILHQNIKDAEKKEDDKEKQSRSKQDQPEKRFQNQGKLNSYIRTLKRILELKMKCEEQTELKELVNMVYHGNNVPWKDFFFEYGQYMRAYNYMQGRKENYHPICIHGIVRKINKPTEKFNKYSIQLHSNEKKKDGYISLKTNLSKEDLPDIREEQEILAYGYWVAKRNPTEKYVYYNFYLNPVHKNQVLTINQISN